MTDMKPTPGRWHDWSERSQAWWGLAGTEMRLYAGGLATLGGAVLLAMLFKPKPIVAALFYTAGAFLAGGFVMEIYSVAVRLWETGPGKLLGALMATMVGALAMGLSSVVANEATGLDPSYLPYTVTFLAPLTAGYILLVATVAISLLCLVAFFVYSLLLWIPSITRSSHGHSKRIADLIGLRMLGWISLVLVTSISWSAGQKPYDGLLMGTAGWFAFTLEMYGHDACAGPTERVRRLSDSVVAVGIVEHGSLRFELRQCPMEAHVLVGANA
jgi:hypothetical protein